MSERGTKTLIGAFVLGAVALAMLFVVLVGSGSFDRKQSTSFVLYFDSSLRGLSPGSPVYFKGVRVGRVASVQILADDPTLMFRAPVVIDVDNSMFTTQEEETQYEPVMRLLIQNGLRATLGMQSVVTGQLTVDLDIYPEAHPVDQRALPRYNGLMQIPTIPSSLDVALNVFSRIPLEDISSEVLALLRQLNLQMAGVDLSAMTDSFTLTSNAAREELLAFGALRDQVQTTLGSVSGMARGAESGMASLSEDFSRFMTQAGAMVAESRRAMGNAGNVLREDSALMLELSQTLSALRDASAAISQLATLLELKPDALIFGRGQ